MDNGKKVDVCYFCKEVVNADTDLANVCLKDISWTMCEECMMNQTLLAIDEGII